MRRYFDLTLVCAVMAAVAVGFGPIETLADDLDHLGSPPAELDRLGIEAGDLDGSTPIPKSIDQAIVEAMLVVQEGDTTPGVGGTVISVNQPFVSGLGDPGFTGNAAEYFVWFGSGVTWISSDGLPSVLSGAEGTMGVGDLGEFIYSPSTDGDDSVWTDVGLLAVENVQAPGLPRRDQQHLPQPTDDDSLGPGHLGRRTRGWIRWNILRRTDSLQQSRWDSRQHRRHLQNR